MTGRPRVRTLLQAFDEAFDRKSWHGTNLRGSIRGLDLDVASWRPAPGRHNIWELVVHAAYWKYTVRRRLAGEPRGTFALPGSNWFERPLPTGDRAARWRDDVALLVEIHGALRQAIAALGDRDLDATVAEGQTVVHTLITGVVAHDLYHAGQIQLIKRLYPGSGASVASR